MDSNKKRFHKSDSTIYCFNSIEYPFRNTDPIFTRDCVHVYASSGVTWEQISEEIHTLRKRLGSEQQAKGPFLPAPILKTCMVDYPEFVVAMTLTGVVNIINIFINDMSKRESSPKEYLYFDAVDAFAKDCVRRRDSAEAERKSALLVGAHGTQPLDFDSKQ